MAIKTNYNFKGIEVKDAIIRVDSLLTAKNIFSRNGRKFILAECVCGKETEYRADKTKYSCGCTRKSINSTHNKSRTKLYKRWAGMKDRCFNVNSSNYYKYGGRGITMCDEWANNYTSFEEWVFANGYNETLEIDRIDNNGNYEPNNCRLVTSSINSQNTRTRVDNSSGYRGVCFSNTRNKWVAQISVNSKHIHIGYFDTAELGAIAYNEYVIANNTNHTLNKIGA